MVDWNETLIVASAFIEFVSGELSTLVWEKKIFHAGLKAYRVVGGPDQATVEFKSQLQTQAWDDRWHKIQLSVAKRKKQDEAAAASFQKKKSWRSGVPAK
jgi:hypothetical protein